MSRNLLATSILIVMVVGYVVTYPLNMFWGSLLNHGFLAAVIGGLADWFGVTALFRKPLGIISYHTEILPRNRERIMDEIANFIGKDLLSVNNIIKNVKRYNLCDMILYYYSSERNKRKLKEAVHEIVLQVIDTIDVKEISKSLEIALKSRRKNFNMSGAIIKFLIEFIKSPVGDKFLDNTIRFLEVVIYDLAKAEYMRSFVMKNIDVIKEKYVQDKIQRRAALKMFDFSSETLLNIALEKFKDYSNNLLDYSSNERKVLKNWLIEQLEQLERKDGYKLKIIKMEHWFFVKNYKFDNKIESLLENIIYDQDKQKDILKSIDKFMDKYIQELEINKWKKADTNEWLLEQLTDLIEKYSPKLIEFVKGKLMKYSDKEFVELVESKVGDDLQMIRINGSVIGAIAGMGLYVIFFVAEWMCNL